MREKSVYLWRQKGAERASKRESVWERNSRKATKTRRTWSSQRRSSLGFSWEPSHDSENSVGQRDSLACEEDNWGVR